MPGPTLPASATYSHPSHSCCCDLSLDRFRRLVPGHRGTPEIGFVRHVTGECRVAPKHHILDDRFPGPHRLEIRPEVRTRVVEVRRAECDAFLELRPLSRLQIMFLVPLLLVCVPHRARIAAG